MKRIQRPTHLHLQTASGLILGLCSLALAISGCKIQGKTHVNNFVSMKGNVPKSVILSLSQDEAKVGMYRLCRGPTGEKYIGYENCIAQIQTFSKSHLPRFEQAAEAELKEEFNSAGATTSPTDAAETDPATESGNQLNLTNQDSQTVWQASHSSTAPAPALFLNETGGGAGVGTDIDAPEKIEIKKVEDPLKTGDHVTPRCWYRYDLQKGIFPDIFSPEGRAKTFGSSQQLTRYSVKSQTIIDAMRADNTLKRLRLQIYDPDILYGQKYNKNLDELQKMEVYAMITTFITMRLGTAEKEQFVNFVSGALNRNGNLFRAIAQGLNRIRPVQFAPGIADDVAEKAWGLYRMCFKGNPLAGLICSGAVSSVFLGIVKGGVGAYTSIQMDTPMLIDMEDADLQTAINMIASSKTNISISENDFEKLAYVPPRSGEKVGGLFGIGSTVKDIGIIPRLGDKAETNFLCPNERIASQIMRFSPLTASQYAEIAEEFDQKIGPQKAVSP